MTNMVCANLPHQPHILHQVVYQQEYQDFGFVCGQIKHGQWQFYVVDTRMKGGPKYGTTVNRLP
ncbi:MAG: hypothetical protein ACREFJ_11080 [Acetobacteraceae bacterium]